MKTASPVFRLLLLVGALLLPAKLLTTAVAAEESDERGDFIASVSVPAGFSESEVQEAIVNTLIGRQWGVKSKEDDKVVGYLKHRSNEAKVTLVYDAAKVDIYCIGWEISKKTGERQHPEQPKGWLKNIQGDLTKNFNRIATQR